MALGCQVQSWQIMTQKIKTNNYYLLKQNKKGEGEGGGGSPKINLKNLNITNMNFGRRGKGVLPLSPYCE